VLGCTFSSVIYYGLSMIGDFCKEERAMGFEESYDVQGMFSESVVEGVGVEGAQEKGTEQKGVTEESRVREL
jgi:NCS1 family nucleobase:cation symporter-1